MKVSQRPDVWQGCIAKTTVELMLVIYRIVKDVIQNVSYAEILQGIMTEDELDVDLE